MMSPDSNKPEESASFTIKCTNCGYRNPPQNNFCGRCGQVLSKADISTPQEKPGATDIPVSYPPPLSPPPAPGYVTQTPRQTASHPTSQPVPQVSHPATVTNLGEPNPDRQSSPAKAPPPAKPTKGSKRANKRLPYALGFVALLVVCCFLAGVIWLVRNFRSVSGLRANTKPPNYGAFLKEDGKFIEMTLYQGGPDSGETVGIPQTENTQPLIILWYPETNLEYLQVAHSESGPVPYDVTPKSEGILEIRAQAPLEQGRYCLRQGGPDIPYVLIPSWCFEVGPGTSYDGESVSQENQVSTETAEAAGQIKLTYQNLRMEENKEHPGWQRVSMDLLLENIGQTPTKVPTYIISGHLTDSGGFDRNLSMPGYDSASHYCAEGAYYLPGIRYRFSATTDIPLNLKPASLTISSNTGVQLLSQDLNQPNDNLSVPFDNPPTSIPLAQSGVLEFTADSNYTVRLLNFKLVHDYERPHLHYTVEVKNSSGYDINDDSLYLQLTLLGMTDRGERINVDYFYIDTIPPGQTGQLENFGFQIDPETKWIWLAIFDKDCKGVMQIIVPVQ